MLFAGLLVGGVVDRRAQQRRRRRRRGHLRAGRRAAGRRRRRRAAAHDDRRRTLGGQYGTIAAAYATLEDDVAFAAEFDRLPDAEAEVLGRTLGRSRTSSHRRPSAAPATTRTGPDIVYALGLARARCRRWTRTASPRPGARRAAVRRAGPRRLRRRSPSSSRPVTSPRWPRRSTPPSRRVRRHRGVSSVAGAAAGVSSIASSSASAPGAPTPPSRPVRRRHRRPSPLRARPTAWPRRPSRRRPAVRRTGRCGAAR